jgi:hypothetical protein
MSKSLEYKLRPIPTSKPIGKFTFNEPLVLKPHEFSTIEKLRRFGDDIKRIAESNKQGENRPDIKWRKQEWEIKTISGNSRANIVHALQSAKSQSPNVVVDIVKTKRQSDAILRDIDHYFGGSKIIRKVFVIIKDKYCVIE